MLRFPRLAPALIALAAPAASAAQPTNIVVNVSPVIVVGGDPALERAVVVPAQPPPVVVGSPATSYVEVVPLPQEPPPVVVVRPVEVQAPATGIVLRPGLGVTLMEPVGVPQPGVVVTSVAAPSCPGCDASTGYAAGDWPGMLLDIGGFGVYRGIPADGISAGGMNAFLRALLTDSLSLEFGFGYLAGGTSSGGNYEEAPISISLLWYPWSRGGASLYVGAGSFLTWTSHWSDDIGPAIDGFGTWGSSRETWYGGGRLVTGAELALLDMFVLTAEADLFARTSIDDSTCAGDDLDCSEVGFSVSLGASLRI